MKGKVLDETAAGKIKEAAKDIFLAKGYDGGTMQAIADQAGVSKAQLHYYFRSKDSLFLLVFKEELQAFFGPNLRVFSDPGKSLREKLEIWIDAQAVLVARLPQLPLFIVTEINRNPQLIRGLMDEMKVGLMIRDLGNPAPAAGLESPGLALEELLTMSISLLVFPAIAAPMLRLLFCLEAEAWSDVQARQVVFAKKLIAASLP
ncbi:MAG: TetR/AcrR family transcriptional regulator [Spirochaetota bacterium]